MATGVGSRDDLAGGILLSYGANRLDLIRRSAAYVDQILRGTTPASLPIQQPLRFDLAIDLQTAKALGITVPPALIAAADEIIE